MSYYIAEPNTPSETVNKQLEKLNKARQSPRVNLPALARRDTRFMETWIADPGYTIISSDFSSLEPSITAHFSQDPYYMFATYGGIGKVPYYDAQGVLMIDDIYLMTASVMPQLRDDVFAFFSKVENCNRWVVDAEGCKSHPLLKGPRKQAKPACLGFNYGMGPKRFVNQSYDAGAFIELSEARAMYKAYWELFKEIRILTQRLENVLQKQTFITNSFGYRLTTEPHKAYNAFIQSSASGVVDVFSLKFFEQLPDSKFIAFIHDEVIYQIPDDQVEAARKLTADCVDSLNADLKFSVPMRLGFATAKTFADIK